MNEQEMMLFRKFSSGLKTKKEYLFMLNEFKSFVNKELLSVSSDDVSNYLDSLENNNNTKRKKYHQLLSFYNYLADDLIININPVRTVSPPTASKQVKMERTLLFENVKPLFDILESHFSFRDYLITLIIATTGLKVSEVTNIRWSDFVIDNNEHIGVMVGSSTYKRYVRIFDFVWEQINAFRLDLGIPDYYLKESYVVFFSERYSQLYKANPSLVKPITSFWLQKVYAKACNMLDIPLVTSKDIRHNYTMLCMKLGSPGDDIKEQLGWSSKDFIYRYNGVVELLDSPINNMVEKHYIGLLEEK